MRYFQNREYVLNSASRQARVAGSLLFMAVLLMAAPSALAGDPAGGAEPTP